jgi:hypothetical protein
MWAWGEGSYAGRQGSHAACMMQGDKRRRGEITALKIGFAGLLFFLFHLWPSILLAFFSPTVNLGPFILLSKM